MAAMAIFGARHPSPLGELFLAGTEGQLLGVWFEHHRHTDKTMPKDVVEDSGVPALTHAADWLDRYFDGERPDPGELSLAPAGSEFRRSVWALLADVPYGETTTYGALAKQAAARLGRQSMSSQAVGGAVGHNPVSIIVPCHRVVGADGSLTGYSGGMAAKIWLLRHEGVDFSSLSVPTTGTAL
ncbi:methylated-DNA--protein-cysteine methyltransferase [Corynebacterium maris DSM 45190]|uniref:Methylated-DNA--protein-cysteine methyltransferase n=2 Tax=Corynebacterium TaxID=1716 RepID=S5TL21_9CORY|nr:methylated-DNA--protein-cysteine methyltransferase [Corynebacterium maris DSM 45190]